MPENDFTGYCRKDVKAYYRKCRIFAASNGLMRNRMGLLCPYNVGSPFERIVVDVVRPFPKTVTVYLFDWAEEYAMHNQEASTVVDVFARDVLCRGP